MRKGLQHLPPAVLVAPTLLLGMAGESPPGDGASRAALADGADGPGVGPGAAAGTGCDDDSASHLAFSLALVSLSLRSRSAAACQGSSPHPRRRCLRWTRVPAQAKLHACMGA